MPEEDVRFPHLFYKQELLSILRKAYKEGFYASRIGSIVERADRTSAETLETLWQDSSTRRSLK